MSKFDNNSESRGETVIDGECLNEKTEKELHARALQHVAYWAAVVAAGGFTLWLLVKFVYPIFEALTGAVIASAIILLLAVMLGLIEIKTANVAWHGLKAMSGRGKEVFWEKYEEVREELRRRKSERDEKPKEKKDEKKSKSL